MNMFKRIFITYIILIFFGSVVYADKEKEFLASHSPDLAPFHEATVLFSIYSEDLGTREIRQKDLFMIVNNHCPGKWTGDLKKVYSDPDNIIFDTSDQTAEFSEDFIHDFGRGLNGKDLANLSGAERILVAGVKYGNEGSLPLRAATILAYALAREVNGTVFDVSTLECFNPIVFRNHRMKDRFGRFTSNVITRMKKTSRGIFRLSTRGMKKYAIPDVSLYNIKKEDLQKAHLFLMAVACYIQDKSLEKKAYPEKITISAAEIYAAVRKDLHDRLKFINQDGSIDVFLMKDEKTDFDDVNRLVCVTDGNGSRTAVIEKVLERLFIREKNDFEYLDPRSMISVRKKARSELPEVLERLKKKIKGEEFYFLIVPDIPLESDSLIWVRGIEMEPGGKISCAVTPNQLTRTLSAGDMLSVGLYSIHDYIIIKDGVIVAGDYFRRNMKK
jgi:hypothetical protein